MNALVWMLTACVGGEEPGGPQEVVDEPAPYIYEDLDDDQIAYDQAEVEAALDLAFASVRDLHAGPPIDAYEAAMVGASDDCPDYYSDGENVYWYDYCTSDAGAAFSGYAFYYVLDDYSDGYYTWDGVQMYAEASIETSDGHAFEGGGYAYLLTGDSPDGGIIYYSVLGGAFSWDGDEIDGTWMGEGLRAETGMWLSHYPEYEANYAYVSGGVTNLPSTYETVSFTDLTYGNRKGGWPCVGEPGGAVSVRAEDGSWFDVVFDVDADTWEVDEALCDGCGTVWHRGEIVGEACPDVSPLVDWESAPW